MRTVELYENVPAESTLEVSFGPEDKPFTSHVLFITSGDTGDADWNDEELRPGPKTQVLEGGRAYMLEMRAAFLQNTEATLTARIRKTDGSIYSTPKVWTLQGTQSQIKLRVLIIRMAA